MLLNKASFATLHAVSDEETRYTLKAIHITETHTEATDGHILVRVSHPEVNESNFPVVEGMPPSNGAWKPALLDKATAVAVKKALPRERSMVILNHAQVRANGEGLAIAVTDLDRPQVFKPRPSTGNFPNTETFLLKPCEPQAVFTFNPDLLAALLKSAKEFGAGGNTTVKLTVYGPDKAVRLEARNDENQTWEALLMPCGERQP